MSVLKYISILTIFGIVVGFLFGLFLLAISFLTGGMFDWTMVKVSILIGFGGGLLTGLFSLDRRYGRFVMRDYDNHDRTS